MALISRNQIYLFPAINHANHVSKSKTNSGLNRENASIYINCLFFFTEHEFRNQTFPCICHCPITSCAYLHHFFLSTHDVITSGKKPASFCLFKSKTIGGITGNNGWGDSKDERPALGPIFYVVMQFLEKNWPK